MAQLQTYSKNYETIMGEYDWLNINDAFLKESEIRLDRNVDNLCTYGITPLDEALVCIANNELVVIGADSAGGKTELCLQIARHNLHRNKKVALYHLEGGWLEAMSRMKWRDICEEYYQNYHHLGITMDYRRWLLNLIKNKTIIEIESKVWEKYKKEYKNNLVFFSSKDAMTVQMFISSLLDFHSLAYKKDNPFILDSKYDLDLIIIDHLQYFSLTKAENEIGEITEILRQVKNITDNYNIPVVLISHLRKKNKDRGLPDQEDFYGSSNIPKIASTAITIAPASDNESIAQGIFPTWIRIVKSRIGIRPNYAMLINFYQNIKSYDNKYKIHKLTSGSDIMAECLKIEELPRWARGAINETRTTSTD